MTAALRALYETLARYEWWRKRWKGGEPELRKRLLPAATAPQDGGEALDRWLFELAAPPPGAAVVDFGCGFGASLLRWMQWCEGDGIGVTTSTFQASCVRARARQQGLEARCRVLEQDFAAPIGRRCDVALAIEAFGHGEDLDGTLAAAAAALVPGGRLVWVEDLLVHALRDDAHVDELARRWSSPPLPDRSRARDAAERAGLRIVHEIDLTARVAAGAASAIARRASRLRVLRALVPIRPWHRLLDAFLGGCALEHLYARGAACYVVRICERIAAP